MHFKVVLDIIRLYYVRFLLWDFSTNYGKSIDKYDIGGGRCAGFAGKFFSIKKNFACKCRADADYYIL